MLKAENKKEILKAAREKWLITYKGTLIRLTGNFSSEVMEAQCSGIAHSKSPKKKSTKNPLSSKLSFRNEDKRRTFQINKNGETLLLADPLYKY